VRPHRYPTYVSTLLQEVKQFDYLGLRLDPMVNMKAAVSCIQEKANKAHSFVLAVSYSLRYDQHHSNPTICSSLVELLNLWKSCLWKSCVLLHFLLYLRYISYETQVKTLQASLNKSLSLVALWSTNPLRLHVAKIPIGVATTGCGEWGGAHPFARSGQKSQLV